MELDALIDFWHPVGWSADIGESPASTTLLDTRLVLWRTPGGELPLDPSAELHLGFDRVAVAYRRALAGLGIEPGASGLEVEDVEETDEPTPAGVTGG